METKIDIADGVNLITIDGGYSDQVVSDIDPETEPFKYQQKQILQHYTNKLSKDMPNLIWARRNYELDPMSYDNELVGAVVACKDDPLYVAFVSSSQRDNVLMSVGELKLENTIIVKEGVEPIPNITDHDKKGKKIRIVWSEDLRNGFAYLLAVLKELYDRHNNIMLDVFIKSKSELDASKEMLNWLESKNSDGELKFVHIHMPGSSSEKDRRKIIRRAHIWVHSPIVQTRSSTLLLEALTAGCYVVAPSHGAISEISGDFIANCYHWNPNAELHARSLFLGLDGTIEHLNGLRSEDGNIKLTSWQQLEKVWVDSLQNKFTMKNKLLQFSQYVNAKENETITL